MNSKKIAIYLTLLTQAGVLIQGCSASKPARLKPHRGSADQGVSILSSVDLGADLKAKLSTLAPSESLLSGTLHCSGINTAIVGEVVYDAQNPNKLKISFEQSPQQKLEGKSCYVGVWLDVSTIAPAILEGFQFDQVDAATSKRSILTSTRSLVQSRTLLVDFFPSFKKKPGLPVPPPGPNDPPIPPPSPPPPSATTTSIRLVIKHADATTVVLSKLSYYCGESLSLSFALKGSGSNTDAVTIGSSDTVVVGNEIPLTLATNGQCIISGLGSTDQKNYRSSENVAFLADSQGEKLGAKTYGLRAVVPSGLDTDANVEVNGIIMDCSGNVDAAGGGCVEVLPNPGGGGGNAVDFSIVSDFFGAGVDTKIVDFRQIEDDVCTEQSTTITAEFKQVTGVDPLLVMTQVGTGFDAAFSGSFPLKAIQLQTVSVRSSPMEILYTKIEVNSQSYLAVIKKSSQGIRELRLGPTPADFAPVNGDVLTIPTLVTRPSSDVKIFAPLASCIEE